MRKAPALILMAIMLSSLAILPTTPGEALEVGSINVIVSTTTPDATIPFSLFVEVLNLSGGRVTQWTGEMVWTSTKMIGDQPDEIVINTTDNGYKDDSTMILAWTLLEPGRQWINFTDTGSTISGSVEFNVPNFYFSLDLPETVANNELFNGSFTVKKSPTEVFTDYTGMIFLGYSTDRGAPSSGTILPSTTPDNFVLNESDEGTFTFDKEFSSIYNPTIFTATDITGNVSVQTSVEVLASPDPQFVLDQSEYFISTDTNELAIPFSVRYTEIRSGFVEYNIMFSRLVFVPSDYQSLFDNRILDIGATVREVAIPTGEEPSHDFAYFNISGFHTYTPTSFDGGVWYNLEYSLSNEDVIVDEERSIFYIISASLDPYDKTYSGYSPHDWVLDIEFSQLIDGDSIYILLNLYDNDRTLLDTRTSTTDISNGNGTISLNDEDTTTSSFFTASPIFLYTVIVVVIAFIILMGVYFLRKR